MDGWLRTNELTDNASTRARAGRSGGRNRVKSIGRPAARNEGRGHSDDAVLGIFGGSSHVHKITLRVIFRSFQIGAFCTACDFMARFWCSRIWELEWLSHIKFR